MGAAEVQEINRMLAAMPSDWVTQLASNRALLRGAGAASDQVPPEHPDAYSVLLALNLNNKDGVSSEAAVGQDPPDGITVPADVKRDAMQGVRDSYKNNYGGYNFIGVARAIQLVVSNKISKAAKNRMRMYFDRKTKQDRLSDQYEKRKGKRYWSWLNWGGDAGARWSGSSKFAALALPAEQANPVRLFSNPEQKDSGFFAVEGHDQVFGGAKLIVYDTRKVGVAPHLFSPVSAFVGAICLDFRGGASGNLHARVMTGSARKGYGPLLYTLGATLFQCPVLPSEDLSPEAREFWEKQPGRKVQPMNVEAFRQRFGSTPDVMRSRAKATTDELLEIERWGDELVARAHAEDPPPVWGALGPDTEPDFRAERRAAWNTRWVSNPQRTDTGYIAAKYRVEAADRVSFLLYDSRETVAGGGTGDPAKMFIGYLQADCEGDVTQFQTCDWEPYLAAANPGYGPMLYTLAATMLGKPLNPSISLSPKAEQFWGRQRGGKVRPMDANAFRLRFGAAPETLLRRDNANISEISLLVGIGRAMITASYNEDSDVSEHIRAVRSGTMHVQEALTVWSKPDKNRIEDANEKAQERALQRYQYAKEMQGERAMPKKNPDTAAKLKMLKVVPAKERIAMAAEPVQLAPDLRMHLQITRTGCRSYITHWEQREMVWISDSQGRKQMFYRSFNGTSGKTQGRWYVTPGPAETQTGGKLWLVKGSPVKDPGYGRSLLLAFENRVNEVLPHTDADVDAWITRLLGIDGDFSYKDQYEAQPSIICNDPAIKYGDAFVSLYGGLCVEMWKSSSLNKQWGVRDIPYPGDAKNNPIPELTKGSKTKYKDYNLRMIDPANKKMGQSQSIVPWQREHEFTQTLEKRCGLYAPSVWYRLGSGEHWVGVCGWRDEPVAGVGRVLSYFITLQSGKSWGVAENKAMRWLRGEDRGGVEQTGAGGVDFLKFSAKYIQEWVDWFKEMRMRQEEKNEKWTTRYLRVAWTDEKRRRVYGRFLTKIGFIEYDSCYLLVI